MSSFWTRTLVIAALALSLGACMMMGGHGAGGHGSAAHAKDAGANGMMMGDHMMMDDHMPMEGHAMGDGGMVMPPDAGP